MSETTFTRPMEMYPVYSIGPFTEAQQTERQRLLGSGELVPGAISELLGHLPKKMKLFQEGEAAVRPCNPQLPTDKPFEGRPDDGFSTFEQADAGTVGGYKVTHVTLGGNSSDVHIQMSLLADQMGRYELVWGHFGTQGEYSGIAGLHVPLGEANEYEVSELVERLYFEAQRAKQRLEPEVFDIDNPTLMIIPVSDGSAGSGEAIGIKPSQIEFTWEGGTDDRAENHEHMFVRVKLVEGVVEEGGLVDMNNDVTRVVELLFEPALYEDGRFEVAYVRQYNPTEPGGKGNFVVAAVDVDADKLLARILTHCEG